jgi:hypothetical protein
MNIRPDAVTETSLSDLDAMPIFNASRLDDLRKS